MNARAHSTDGESILVASEGGHQQMKAAAKPQAFSSGSMRGQRRRQCVTIRIGFEGAINGCHCPLSIGRTLHLLAVTPSHLEMHVGRSKAAQRATRDQVRKRYARFVSMRCKCYGDEVGGVHRHCTHARTHTCTHTSKSAHSVCVAPNGRLRVWPRSTMNNEQ